MKKIVSLSIICLLILPTSIFADGMIHIDDPDMHRWRIYDEKQQLCAINYENGYQRMILAVDFNTMDKDQSGVWIFPVPASPDETVIDVVRGFPELWGHDIEKEVNERVSLMFSVMRLSQVYTFPLFIMRYMFGSMGAANIESFGGKGLGGTVDGLTIHERIVKYGVTTELVSARNGDALYKHLTQRKGLDLPQESRAVIDEYIGQDYSFVVSWFSGDQENTDPDDYYYRDIYYDTVSVSLTFPTEEIYYPLKPTSVYGSKRVPALIYVMGHVTPNLYPEIEMDSEVTYFIQNSYYPIKELKSFFGGEQRIENLKYTKIKINPPSKYLTQDLWIENSPPPEILMKTSFIENSIAWGLFFFIISSCLASMIAGLIIFNKDRPSMMKFALFGLSNLFTLIGFAIASHVLKIDRRFTKSRIISRRKLKFGEIMKRSFITSLIVSGVFLYMGIYFLFYGSLYSLIVPLALFGIVFLLVTPIVWGYYNNKKVMGFIICFTISFLIITVVFQILLKSII